MTKTKFAEISVEKKTIIANRKTQILNNWVEVPKYLIIK